MTYRAGQSVTYQPLGTRAPKPRRSKKPILFLLLSVIIGLVVAYCVSEAPENQSEPLAVADGDSDSDSDSKLIQPASLAEAGEQTPDGDPPTEAVQGKEVDADQETVENTNSTDTTLTADTPAAPQDDLPHVISGEVEHSLYTSFARHFDREDKEQRLIAEQLAAHFKRIFFFDINFKRDLRPGDPYSFIWEKTEDSTDGIRILAASFHSLKKKETFEGYFFQPSGANFGRHYFPDGQSTQKELIHPPLHEFEQVTSLLRDRRPRHLGIDFKAPVGTPVYMPYDGKIVSVSRRIKRGNGRFIKCRYSAKNLEALFLHLDSIEPGLKAGMSVKAGTLIGKVGNTGRSYAPHLHYQVQKKPGAVLDPYNVHGATRRKVPEKDKAAFLRAVSAYRSEMGVPDK